MIELENVSKSYDGGLTWSVRDVSFTVAEGEVLALVGGSGSGKSTTVKMINRLIEPSDGTIRIVGHDVLRQCPVALRRQIGYVFQGVGLFPHLTLLENVTMVPRLLQRPRPEYLAQGRDLLDLVQLPAADFADRYPGEISGGQRQRVGFARALAAGPRVMLLDEPFGALDPITRDALQQEFRDFQKRLGLTAVLVTHDMAEAFLLADQIAVMQAGRVLQIGTAHDLLTQPSDPYVAELIATPRRHVELLRAIEAGH